ncbi:spore maturation protein [Clostridiaceae bacterium OttesenSCG-928-D20]|nr:spore maturation protein [Clostridiaceae bacterium OttesenSCG-928-D20]
MTELTNLLVPIIIAIIAVHALYKKVDIFSALVCGAREGLNTVLSIFPSLVVLLSAVYMLRASGVLELLTSALSPVLRLLGIPPETAPLMLLRPISGSGALAIGAELIQGFGADSQIGRTVSVMLGSTETTFYVIAIYFGALGIKKSRHAVPSALLADFAGFLMSAFFVRLFFSP